MTIGTIKELLEAQVICGEDNLDVDVHSACGSDMMSDVLAYVKDQAVLLTGLVNAQVIRTAEMMDMRCIVFVRSKRGYLLLSSKDKKEKMVFLPINPTIRTAMIPGSGRFLPAGKPGQIRETAEMVKIHWCRVFRERF